MERCSHRGPDILGSRLVTLQKRFGALSRLALRPGRLRICELDAPCAARQWAGRLPPARRRRHSRRTACRRPRAIAASVIDRQPSQARRARRSANSDARRARPRCTPPEDRQRHVLAPEFAMHGPVWLCQTAMTRRVPAPAPSPASPEDRSSDVVGRAPDQPPLPQTGGSSIAPVEEAVPLANLNLLTSYVAHRKPLHRHPGPPSQKPQGRTVSEPEGARRGLITPGRHDPGVVGQIMNLMIFACGRTRAC
jgi:hypothetical protein